MRDAHQLTLFPPDGEENEQADAVEGPHREEGGVGPLLWLLLLLLLFLYRLVLLLAGGSTASSLDLHIRHGVHFQLDSLRLPCLTHKKPNKTRLGMETLVTAKSIQKNISHSENLVRNPVQAALRQPTRNT